MDEAEEGDGAQVRPKVKRVLIYRLGSLGDTVVALPSLHLIARAYPNAERRMLTNFPVNVKAPAAAAVLGDSGLVQGYFRYAVGTRSVRELLSVWWRLAWWRPQALVYLGPVRGIAAAKRDAMFFKACGIFQQIGVPVTAGMQNHVFQAAHGALEPECERLARNIAVLGDAQVDTRASWNLCLTAAEEQKALEVFEAACGRAILAVCVGTKMQSKDWGRENWRELLARLGGMFPEYALALMGAGEESDASAFAAAGWRVAAGGHGMGVDRGGQLAPRAGGGGVGPSPRATTAW